MERVFCSDSLRPKIILVFSLEFIDDEVKLQHVPQEDLVVAVVDCKQSEDDNVDYNKESL